MQQPTANSITNMNKWMNDNFLKLNEDKTDVLLCGPKSKREMLTKNLRGLNPLVYTGGDKSRCNPGLRF